MLVVTRKLRRSLSASKLKLRAMVGDFVEMEG